MIVSPAFAGKRYAVLGLARSGLAAAETLLARLVLTEPRSSLRGWLRWVTYSHFVTFQSLFGSLKAVQCRVYVVTRSI